MEYFPPSKYAAATAKGTINLTLFVPFEGRSESGGWDDTGYPIALQLWVLMGGSSSFETVAALHNAFVVACAVAFAAAALLMTRSLLAGWLCLTFALILRYVLRGLLFGALDNRTLIVFFPLAFVLLVLLVRPASRRITTPTGALAALGIGAVIEMADLVRHVEGMLAFYAILLACLVVRVPLWRRAATAGLVVIGSTLVMIAVPVGVRIFNAAQTGRSDVQLLSLVWPISRDRHSAWHTLQCSIGRYPNLEGLYYNDSKGFLAVEQAYPELVKSAGRFEAARAYYLWYVRTHTLDWFRYIARGTLEVFYLIPYTTSVGSLPWALGYLPAKEGVVPELIEDPRDVPYDVERFPRLRNVGHGLLLNLRLGYLKLSASEWFVFLTSLTCLPAAIWAAARRRDVDNCRAFFCLAVYVGLGIGARALIPTYGQALVVAYWGVSMLALTYLLGIAWRALTSPIGNATAPVMPTGRPERTIGNAPRGTHSAVVRPSAAPTSCASTRAAAAR